MGIDNSDADYFKISTAENDVGTNTRLSIGTAGGLTVESGSTTVEGVLEAQTTGATTYAIKSTTGVYISAAGAPLVMQSPDGTCSRCGPDNSDVWACVSITCP